MWEYIDRDGTRTVHWSETTAELMTRLKMESAYMSLGIKTKDGTPLVDDYAVTSDEEDIATQFIKDAVNDAVNTEFDKLDPMPYVPDWENGQIDIYARWQKGFEGREQQVEDNLLGLCAASAMLKWLSVKGLSAYMQVYEARLQTARAELHRALFRLRA